uniref:Secreted protein n=1 Tax=Globodera pallida TaxID=36090 RepID=A0A183C8B4_GLOPA
MKLVIRALLLNLSFLRAGICLHGFATAQNALLVKISRFFFADESPVSSTVGAGNCHRQALLLKIIESRALAAIFLNLNHRPHQQWQSESRQVRTRGGGDSVSHWRCQQRIGSTCSGLVRLEGKNLMVVKGHKHLPDYAATRAILSDVHGEYTRLNLVSGQTERRRNASTDEPTTMETDELIRSITSRKELLTVKVSPST